MSQQDDEVWESKSDLKIKADFLQQMGERLILLSESQLDHLELPDRLRRAIVDVRSIGSFGARRRQTQYIGKLMRDDTLDIDAITHLFEQLDGDQPLRNLAVERAEEWMERIVGDDSNIFVLRDEYPEIDTQRLRQWARNARNAKQEKRALKSRKEMSHYLESLLS